MISSRGASIAYTLADLVTWIYHYAIDNYGDTQTHIFGSQIDVIQWHRK